MAVSRKTSIIGSILALGMLTLAMAACSSPGNTSDATSTTPTRTPVQAVATAPTEENAQPGPSGVSGTRMCVTANLVVTIEEAASPNSDSDLVDDQGRREAEHDVHAEGSTT